MSHINGSGFGSDHNWVAGGTTQSPNVPYGTNSTYYECADCLQHFSHYYHSTPDIFEAIKNAGITEKCPKAQPYEKPTPKRSKK